MLYRIAAIKTLLLSLFFVCYSLQTFAQDDKKNEVLGRRPNAITTAVPFLMIGPDSRTGGMGEVGVALPNDMNAQHWNPAKYVFSDKLGGISISYSPWLYGLGLHDIYLAYLSGYVKINKLNAVSLSLRYFSMA